MTTEELARLASTNVLESEAYFELWRRTHALVSDVVHHWIYGQDARHTVTAFYCHKLPRVLHKYRPQAHPGASFEAWLTTVLRNYLKDERRRAARRRRRQARLDTERPDPSAPAYVHAPRVEQQAEHDHLVFFLREVMEQTLDPEERYLFRAHYWEGKSLREIARELGLPEESVRVRHYRAKKRLHKACAFYRGAGLL